MTRDPSLFGWMLPEPGALHVSAEFLFVIVGYYCLYRLLRWSLNGFQKVTWGQQKNPLEQKELIFKPWTKWAKRCVSVIILILMFADPIYYYFGIVRGQCTVEQELKYPAPPASYVILGPISTEESDRFFETILKQQDAAYKSAVSFCKNRDGYISEKCTSELSMSIDDSRSWQCTAEKSPFKTCIVRGLTPKMSVEKLPFGFIRESDALVDSSNKVYEETYSYKSVGHWLTSILFGVKLNFIDYANYSSCSVPKSTKKIPITLNN